ncbi:hypothetical protein ACLKA6_016441 [Drosophila palustris]
MTLRCRTCASVIYNQNAINLFEFEHLEILANIQTVAGTVLECDPELPSHICGCCLLDLKRAVKHMKVFRERCIKTQKKLRNTPIIYDGKLNDDTDTIIKEEVHFDYYEDFQKIDKDREIANLDEDMIEFQEGEEGITNNTLDDTDQDVDSFIASVQNDMNSSDSQESEEEFENISSPNHSSFSNLTGPTIKNEKTNKYETEKKKTSTVSSPDNDADENNVDKVKKKRYKSCKNPTEEQVIARKRQRRQRDFYCDQCGRHFTDQSNFKLHMLRHSGIKNFQCKQCSKPFYTEHLMQWHEKLVHQDGRPYACKYCEKSFKNSSARIVHERSHTNVRPYSCKFCEKAFTNISGLNRHTLIHNGVRAYFCKICDKNFQRTTHLKAHLRSKQHALKQTSMDL